ncbi:MAG: selenide, water dikinase SelD, partial [Candidatus Acidiferrum sp.]
MSLLNTADGSAVLSYGPLTIKNHKARQLKDRIDRAWMASFTRLSQTAMYASAVDESPEMRCGGCGSKIGGDVLSSVLNRLDVPKDPRVLFGCREGEDAAVFRADPRLHGSDPDKLVEIQTVDYFKSFVDDPYLFGRIAAIHAISDLYAMNARPFTALAIATLPFARGPIQETQLFELLSGAVRSLRERGVTLTGGHTTEGNVLALGFAVTGFGEEGKLFLKSELKHGDRLILTKPLGSGALLAAWMRGGCEASWFEELTSLMLKDNAEAAAVFRAAGVSACTDVTGFGLAGHLLEMLDGSRASARLFARQIPLMRGFEQVVASGIVSTLHDDNAKCAGRIRGAIALPASLFDPQTSGGLLAGVRPEVVEETLRSLKQAG